jgi:F-type H+-transporting ATPase subunit b
VIKLNWTIWLQFANFFVLMIILNFLLYRPLRKILSDRRDTVEGSYRKARELEEQINEKMARYQERLQEAKLKGNQEKASLRAAALQKEAEILSEAHEAAAKNLKSIKNQVVAEAGKARRSLREEAQALAAGVASKVLGREL